MYDLEASPSIPKSNIAPLADQQIVPNPGETDFVYFNVAGPKFYVDAASKTRPNQSMARSGLGVYFTISDQGSTTDILISASSSAISSAL
jgi:hypothetical protein